MIKHIDKKNRYDYEMDLSLNTSIGIIVDDIKPGSVVLEFGCAMGRMTHYLRDELLCKVYIVEINEDSYKVARQYAEDGICTDAQELAWSEYFSDIKFDYIVFADVLEHIADPKSVVQEASRLLAEDGTIVVSIPNITNNDVLIKAYYDHFDYTEVGLLDDTHVHFWGYENIRSFAQECGLGLVDVAATYTKLGETEQGADLDIKIDPMVVNMFRGRKYGNVYQFIFRLKHIVRNKENDNVQLLAEIPGIEGYLYYDYGLDFSEDNKERIIGRYHRDGVYVFDEVRKISGLKRLRFDPIEGQACILRNARIYQNGKTLEWKYCNAEVMEDIAFIHGDDPFAWVDINEDEDIILHAEAVIQGREYLEIMGQCISDYEKNTAELYNELAIGKASNVSLQEDNNAKSLQISELAKNYAQLNECFEGMKGHADVLQSKINELNSKIAIQTETLNLKEKEVSDICKELDKQRDDFFKSTQHINNLQTIIDKLNGEIEKTFEDNRQKDLKIDKLWGELETVKLDREIIKQEREKINKDRENVEKQYRLDCENLKGKIDELNDNVIELEKQVKEQERDKEFLKDTISKNYATISAYAMLANNKDELLVKKEEERVKTEEYYQRLLMEKDAQIANLSGAFKNRLWNTLKRIYRKVRSVIFRK